MSCLIFYFIIHFLMKKFQFSDTDSLHLVISENDLSLCILPEYKSFFLQHYNSYFGNDKFAGVLILEMKSNTGTYDSEKCYSIGTTKKQKSVPSSCHELAIFNNQFRFTAISKHPVLGITVQVVNKTLSLLLIPRKRFFVDNGKLSYPITI